MWIWIGVQDALALHAQYVHSGAKIRNQPNNFEWALEMQIEDLDGNVLSRFRPGKGRTVRRMDRRGRSSLETAG
jgi:hypothetical protein